MVVVLLVLAPRTLSVIGIPPLVVLSVVGIAEGEGVGSASVSGLMSQLLGTPEALGVGVGSDVGISPLPRRAMTAIAMRMTAARPVMNDFMCPIIS